MGLGRTVETQIHLEAHDAPQSRQVQEEDEGRSLGKTCYPYRNPSTGGLLERKVQDGEVGYFRTRHYGGSYLENRLKQSC